MTSIEKIEADLMAAFKAKETQVVSTLRLLRAALKNKSIELKKDLEEEEVVAVVKSQVKQLKDSVDAFVEGAREDLAVKAREELEILAKYLPEQMGEDELKTIVDETVAETGAAGAADMGKVMGAVMGKVKGKADGGDVKRLVDAALK
ncbi:MAG: GatB/YqeY domain-containing protein [Candidatus Uhrbacteria bacterium]|nr:GatB/YqeY domain-containing protein [Patescibacteria group bacterium]MBU1907376.1 GatB/YqeY domain-containing protein [Patescibacteria group bacterium]